MSTGAEREDAGLSVVPAPFGERVRLWCRAGVSAEDIEDESDRLRCTTPASSDVILGHGWAGQGYSATDIDPMARGVSWLLAEGGIPRRMRAAYLDDDQVRELAMAAAQRRATAREAS